MVPYQLLRCFLFVAFFLITYFPTNYAHLDDTARPEVTIDQGNLVGKTLKTRNGRSISAFQGIPFAQPPTGSLRFANPIAAGGWNGTLNADTVPAKCPQTELNLIVGEEDCLYLNVYTPQLPQHENSSLLSVMVYIHGGGFKQEYPSNNGPGYLLDADVVLVTFNYRLGPLGFLSTGDEVASGNWGLKDQVLALKWAQDNIRRFGGDPERVTIFGESAGAGSVHLLTLSNATIGLFHRYITQSGSAFAPWAYRPRTAYSNRAFELGEYVGCNKETSDSLISCLRTVGVSDIIGTFSRFTMWTVLSDVTWGPTDEPDIEGAILTESPSDLYAARRIRDLPWMSGVVRDEGLILAIALYEDLDKLNNFLEDIDSLLPIMLYWTYQSNSGAAWTKATKSFYFNDDLTVNTNLLLANLTKLISDSNFNYPGYKALQQHHALAVNSQYFYTFNYRGSCSLTDLLNVGSTANYGVAHTDELIYLFPKESVFSDVNKTMSEADYKMVDTMVQLWTSFAINGTPTATNGAVTWEPYSTDEAYLEIGNESDLELKVEYSFLKERMQFWNSIDAVVGTQEDSSTVTSPDQPRESVVWGKVDL